MNIPTFKRAKRIVALHYGSDSFKTRRLCQLFRHSSDAPKNELIVREAARILELRHSLGYDTTNAGIDATMAREVQSQIGAHTGQARAITNTCVTCKQLIKCAGWLVDTPTFLACPGDCTMVADFYYTRKGSKHGSVHAGFKRMFGKAVEDLPPDQSFDAMLAYQLHLTASRIKQRDRNAKLENPTYRNVSAD